MTRFSFSSLRARVALLVLLAVVPALGLALYTGLEQRRLAAAQVQENALQLARHAASDHERLIEGARQLLMGVAQFPAVRRHDAGACNRLFAGLLKQYPSYANLTASKPDGETFCSAVPLLRPLSAADRGWFQRSVQTRGFALGEYQFGRITGKAVLVAAYPSLGAAGQVQAVVALAVDLASLNDLAAKAQLPPGSVLIVIDRSGTILVHYPEPEKWVGRSAAAAPIVKAILDQREGVAEAADVDGTPRLFGFAPLGSTPEAGAVYVGVGIPKGTAFADADRTLARNLAGLGLVSALALVTAWVGNLFLVRRTNALVNATKRLATGELGARTGPPYGRDEVSQLARAFDEMAEALEQRAAALQQSEARFSNILRTAPDAIIWVNEAQQIVLFNQGAERIFGYRAEEVLGQPLDLLLPPRFVEVHRRHVRDFAAAPEVARFVGEPREVFGRRKDGGEFPAEASISKLAEDGRLTFTVILRDNTERKRAEETLERLYQDEGRQRREAEAFATLVKDLATSLDLDRVLAGIVGHAKVLGEADLVFLALAGANGQALTIRAQTGAVSSLLPGLMLPRGRGVVGNVLETGTPQVTDEDRQDPLFSHDFDPVARAEGIVAQAAIPIVHGGTRFGVLLAARRAPRPFTLGDVQTLARLADAASLTCYHALLYQQATSRAATLERLWQVGQALGRPLALPATLDQIVQTASECLRADHAVLTLWDEAAQRLTVGARLSGEDQQFPREFRPGEGAHGTVAATRRPLIVNDYQGFPARVPELTNVLTATAVVPLLIGDRLVGTLGVYATEQGKSFTAEDLMLLQLLAQPAATALENARLHNAAVARAEELAALLRATQTLMARLEPQVILERIVEEAARISGVPRVAAFLVDKKKQVLRPGALMGGTMPAGFHIPLGKSFSGAVATTGQPLLVPDTRNDPRRVLTERERGVEFEGYLGIPIKVREETVGVLAFYSESPRQYSQDNLAYLTSFAAQAAVALENARLFEQVRAGRERLQALSRRLVETQELRSRELSRELHDEIGQILTGLKLTLEMSMRSLPKESRARLGEAQALVHDLLSRVRELSLDLRPAMLDDLGLLPALLWHFDRYSAQTRVRVSFKQTGLKGRRFPPELETAAYRIVQEALTNVARHAGVGQVTVRLWAGQGTLGIQIEDRGTGFDPEAALAAPTTSGLAGMRERATLLGGHLAVESAPGAGTRVTAELPLGEPVERRAQGRGA